MQGGFACTGTVRMLRLWYGRSRGGDGGAQDGIRLLQIILLANSY
jgi:hypothetical protein